MPRGRSLAWLEPALALLSRSATPEARETIAAIARGRVRIRLLGELTRTDLERARRDLQLPRLSLRTALRTLNGYTCSNRIYVHRALSPSQLAATLVHEVNHVLNDSQAHYRTAKDILREEYRAFVAEQRFAGLKLTPARCHALKLRIIREYQLAGVTAADVLDSPASRASRARR